MQQETFIIGNREFTCIRMNAFAANRLLMRLQKVAVPIIGAVMGGGKSLGDMNVAEAARVIAENVDERMMDDIVLPLLTESRAYCTEQKKFISKEMDVNQCFTVENLFEFYELVFEVARYQFGPFFGQLMSRFGNQNGALAAVPTK